MRTFNIIAGLHSDPALPPTDPLALPQVLTPLAAYGHAESDLIERVDISGDGGIVKCVARGVRRPRCPLQRSRAALFTPPLPTRRILSRSPPLRPTAHFPPTRYVIRKGDGAAAKKGAQISAHYDGKLTDGKGFDSSRKRGQPFKFGLGGGQVIKGWDLGFNGMQVGEKAVLEITSQYVSGRASCAGPGRARSPRANLLNAPTASSTHLCRATAPAVLAA